MSSTSSTNPFGSDAHAEIAALREKGDMLMQNRVAPAVSALADQAEAAAQAGLLRLRQEGKRIARNTAMLAAATLFVLFALAMLHAAAVAWLAIRTGTPAAILWVALGDVVLAAILFALGRRKTDKVAMEALQIRRRALQQIGTGTMVGDVLRIFRRDRPARTLGGSIAQSLLRSVTGR